MWLPFCAAHLLHWAAMRLSTALLVLLFAVPAVFAQAPATAPAATGVAPTTTTIAVVSPEVHPDHTVTLRFEAPNAQKVTVSVEGDPKPLPLTKNAAGVWEVTTEPKAPEFYGYSFSVDGKRELDPRNPNVRPNLLSPTTVLHVLAATPQPWDLTDIPHGEVTHHVYESKLAAKDGYSTDRDLYVYTPPGYDAKRKETYPVLYLIHGFSDAANGWVEAGQANLIFDSLLHDGKVKPFVVVMPKGYGTMEMIETKATVRPPALGVKNQETFSDQMLHEILPMVEARYNIARDPAHRAMAGLSMGGGHSQYTALNHPEVFGYVGMFSSGITSAVADIRGKDVDAATYDKAFKAMLPNIATQVPVKLLWISCGTEDSLISVNHGFETWAKTNLKGNVQVRDTPGMHTWMVWRDDLIAFTPLLFK